MEQSQADNSKYDDYIYSFELEEGYNYFLIGVQLEKSLDYLSILFTEYEKETKTYEIKYSTDIKIDKNDLVQSSDNVAFYLRSKERHTGNNYMTIKVKKGIDNETFYAEGYGYPSKEPDEDMVPLDIQYNKEYQTDKYIIYEYFFDSTTESQYFTMNVYIYKKIDYLSIRFDSKSGQYSDKDDEDDKDDDDSGGISSAAIAIIVIVCILIVGVIIFFVLRKLGYLGKNEISSKDIESANQIIQ